MKSAVITDSTAEPNGMIDPFLVEIVRNGLIATTEEMKIVLMRTAYNMIIYEALDFTVGLFTPTGETVSIGLGLPMFIRGMSDTVKAKIAHFGVENLEPGDILLTNDAYTTGSHLNHLTFSMPIFTENRLVGFSSCMAHWPDVGGTLSGVTTDIYSEGLQIPFIKIYRRGEPNEDAISFIRMNVRIPDRAMGDFRAQVAAVDAGRRNFLELITKYGCDNVLGSIAAIMDQSEAACRAKIREIPNGNYEADAYMDNDGISLDSSVPIRVKVAVFDDRIAVDLSEVADQVPGYYNSGETAGRSCCQVAFKCLTSPLELPINEGQFRALDVILPAGKVISAVKPAAMRMWMTFPMTVVDTIFKAVAPAMPDQVIAGHHADLVLAMVYGRKPIDNSFYIYLGGLIGGGWGAKHDSDGMCATIAINDGDTHNGPTEQVESKYPLLVEKYELRQDSGGPGKWRGGLGTEQVVRALRSITFSSLVDRTKCRPWGIFGGLSGFANAMGLRHDGEFKLLPGGKIADVTIRSGDAYVLRSGGGGGYGSPIERPTERVLEDVRQGYVSIDRAATKYGVVVSRDDLELDAEQTLRLRKHLAENPPCDDPPEMINGELTIVHDHQHLEHLTETERELLILSGRCCG
jgi:N-methylhydantoinase B